MFIKIKEYVDFIDITESIISPELIYKNVAIYEPNNKAHLTEYGYTMDYIVNLYIINPYSIFIE
jgi:hypothetical protein